MDVTKNVNVTAINGHVRDKCNVVNVTTGHDEHEEPRSRSNGLNKITKRMNTT